MPNVQIPLVGPTYTSISLPVSAQVTRGFYLELDQNSENQALVPFPGLTLWATTGAGNGRGLGTFNNELYAVTGNTLYKIASNAAATSIGAINGSSRCVLETSTGSIVIANDAGKPYEYDGTTLTQGTDVDLPNAATVTYIRNRVVYDGDNSDIVFADLSSPLVVNSANITSDDVKPDDTLAVKAFRDQLFAFSEKSIAPYYNSGVGNPPYSIIQNAVQEVGLGAIHSIDSNYRSLYFLGSDFIPYRIGGIQPEPIGNPSIGQAIQSYPNKEDAYGVCFNFNNEYFYMLTFPGSATWLFCENSASWTNLSYGVDGDPHLILDYAYCYGKHLVSDRSSGNIYELDFDAFDDNGEVIVRQRDTIKVSGKMFGAPGKEIFMHSLELIMETGTGIISGQGSDPVVMMSYSDDGGRTWSPEQWASFGQMGSFTYSTNPRWFDLGSFFERQFRFKVTDPVKTVFISCNADISVGV